MNAALLLAETGEISPGVTGLFACLLVGLITCLALEEKLHAKKSVIAGIFAIVCLLLGTIFHVLPFNRVVVGSNEIVEHPAMDGEVLVEPEGELQPIHIDAVEFPDGWEAETPPASAPPADSDPTGDETGRDETGRDETGRDETGRDAPETAAGEEGEEGEHHPLHVDGHRLTMPVFIPGIDWGVIAIILGSSLFVDVTSKSGLFTWIAIRVTKASGGDPLLLLWFYGIMTVAFSAVLNNVTAMIIVGSLTVVSLEKLGRRDKLLGFLIIEGLLTNIGGLLTLISSVPNIIVGSAANISFVTFFIKSAPFVVVATAVTLWMGARLFGIGRLATEEEREAARAEVAAFDETDGIESWGFFWFGAAMLVLFILTIATTSVLPYVRELEMGFVALAFAGVMLLRYKSEVDQFYRAVDWDLLGFFMALFVVIYVMEHAAVLAAIGSGLQLVLRQIEAPQALWSDATVLLLGAAGFSSVTDNIPLAAMLASILKSLHAPIVTASGEETGLWWSVIFGANLGGNLTPIGSASTLVAVTLIHKHNLKLSFSQFVRTAAPYALVQILLAVIYVLLVLPWL